MMFSSGIRAGLIGATVGCLLAAGMSAAYAAVWSAGKTFSSNGVSYRNSTYGDNGSSVGTVLHRNNHGQASEGKMGARARVYWDDGTLCEASVWRYNSQPTDHFRTTRDHNCGGYIFSRGRTKTWNGNGYKNISTKRTPNWYG